MTSHFSRAVVTLLVVTVTVNLGCLYRTVLVKKVGRCAHQGPRL